MALQNLRSNTANKRPTASGMVDGQVAINTNATNPGLFFKDAGDGIRKVGPVFIGSSAPNSSPAAGGSSGHSIGEQWLDTSGSRYVVKTWDGTAWRDDDSNYLQLTGGALSGALTIDNAANVAALDLKFDGDTDTGFYAPAANTLGFVGGGTERVRIDNSGRVGIGTTGPSTNLHVLGNQTRILVDSTNASSNVGFSFGDNGTTVGGVLYSNTDDALYFQTNGTTERVRIDSSGNVGIGTSSPANTLELSKEANHGITLTRPAGGSSPGTCKIDVQGNGKMLLQSDNDIEIKPNASGNVKFSRQTASEVARIDSSGRLMLGTTTPGVGDADEFTVAGSGNIGITIRSGTTSSGNIFFSDATSGTAEYDGYIQYRHNDRALRFATAATERLRIDSSGRVGIGTTSPRGLVHLHSSGAPRLDFTNTTTGTGSGDGTTISVDGSSGALNIIQREAQPIQFYTSSTERMRIDSSGNVGIGVTSPGSFEGAGLQVRKYVDRSATYHSPDGHYAGSFGYTNNTQDKVWLAVDSGYGQSSAISAGLFLSSFHQDAGGSACGSTIKNLKSDNSLTFSRVTTASSVNNPAVETELMRIDSSGLLGVGTSSPSQLLHIAKASGSAVIELQRTNANTTGTVGALSFTASDGHSVAAIAAIGDGNDEGADLVFRTTSAASSNTFFNSTTERMRIDSSGNVGIGTTSPSALLDCELGTTGTIAQFRGADTDILNIDGDSNQITLDSRNVGALAFEMQGSEAMRIDNSGRLLVGLSSSLLDYSQLQLSGGSDGTGHICFARNSAAPTSGQNIGSQRFTNSAGGIGAIIGVEADANWTAGSSFPSRIIFATTASSASSPTERMRIDSSGRLGVGLTPSSTASITNVDAGLIQTDGNIDIRYPGTSTDPSGSRYLSFVNTDSTLVANQPMGGIRWVGNDTSNTSRDTASILAFCSGNSGAASHITFNNNGDTERMRIDTSGRLLINTSSAIDSGAADGSVHMTAAGGGKIFMMRDDSGSTVAGNDLGMIRFYSNDGGVQESARIEAEADLDHGTNDKPGRLVFSTTSDGASSPTERVRIDRTGAVKYFGNSSSAWVLYAASDTTSYSQLDAHFPASNRTLFFNENSSNNSYVVWNRNSGSSGKGFGLQGQNFKVVQGSSEQLRVDSSGRLLVGTSSFTGEAGVVIEGSSAGGTTQGQLWLNRGATPLTDHVLGMINFGDNNAAGRTGAMIQARADLSWNANDYPSRLAFFTTKDNASSPTERMRIDNAGKHSIYGDTNVLRLASNQGATTAFTLIQARRSETSTTSTTGSDTFRVFCNGNVENSNNSYGGISDAKLKENIVDASSQWDDIKDIRVRNYNFIEGQTHTQLGVVAQEVETVSPGLVTESPDRDDDGNDLGTVTKSVNYSVLYMKAVKALQEAMDRIETLETKVAALEAE